MATENPVVWHVSCLQQAQRCPFTEQASWALRKVLTTIDRQTTTAYLYAHVGVTLSRCFGCATPPFALQHERRCSSETSALPDFCRANINELHELRIHGEWQVAWLATLLYSVMRVFGAHNIIRGTVHYFLGK